MIDAYKKNLGCQKTLKVGFDLDGVLLYNPARILRPFVTGFKKNVLGIKKKQFYIPKTTLEKYIWILFHKSSIFISPGIDIIEELVNNKKIEAYIVSARYSFLEKDSLAWIKKINKNNIFKGVYLNKKDEQPHIFKKNMINKLKLDIFVEDNFDVVEYIHNKTKARILWVYNIFDALKKFPEKFPNLKSAVLKIKKTTIPQKKRLLLVSEYFMPHWTGISKAFYFLAENLSKQGYDITILTTQFNKSLPLQEKIGNLHIKRYGYIFKISRTHWSLKIIGAFLKHIQNADGVIINSPNSNILAYSIITKLFRKRLAIFHQGDIIMPKKTGSRIKGWFIERIFDICTIPSFCLCDIASTYTLDYAENSRVMKYALSKFKPFIPRIKPASKTPSKKIVSALENIKNNAYIVGFAGRFVEEKGFDVLLKAIPLVVKKLKNVKFVFAGKTDIEYESFFAYEQRRIEKNKRHLVFLGLLDEADLSYFYKNIDVFVISSRSDCFPTTQIEASLSKKPIVVTDIPGARMLVKETGFGEIVPPENPKRLAEGICKALKNKKSYPLRYQSVLHFFSQYENFSFY